MNVLFSIQEGNKMKPKGKRKVIHKIKWVVHPDRRDKRAGVINPGVRDPYTTYAFREIEKVFRKED
jgi:hypothetical protein